MTKLLTTLLATGLLLLAPLATAKPIERKICVFAIAGNVGPLMGAMREWKVQAMAWGLDAELLPYTNEGVAAEDLMAGQCDATLMTGLRARKFNKYSGTIDSIGSIPTMKHMKILLHVLADPRSADKLTAHGFEIMGIAPIGAAYIFVDDRSINTLSEAAGKKIAVLQSDPTQAIMVAQLGATPVPSDITNFAGKFNNGVVDIIAAPLAAYNILELYKGLIPNGGIIDYPLLQLTVQLVAREDRFPEAMMQKSREYFFAHVDNFLAKIKREAKTVNDKWWVEIPKKDKQKYRLRMADARHQLLKAGYYDKDMLVLLQRIRCKLDPTLAECTSG